MYIFKGGSLKKLILFLSIVPLFASMILNLNVKESKSRVDLFINFDIPFEGTIVKKLDKEKIILYIKDAKILSPWSKKLHTPFLYEIDVTPARGGSNVVLYTTKKVKVNALRSKDGFSLKISILNPYAAPPKSAPSWHISLSSLWWIVAGVVALLLIFLLLRIVTKGKTQKSKTIVLPTQQENFVIKFEKPLDERNKIALISHKGINYLVIIGNNNVLLGKYREGEIESVEDFEEAIRTQNIEEAIPPKHSQEEIFTTLEEYKKKASGD